MQEVEPCCTVVLFFPLFHNFYLKINSGWIELILTSREKWKIVGLSNELYQKQRTQISILSSNTMIWQHFCITFYTIHSFFTNHLSKMNQQKEIHLKQYKNIKLFRMSTIGMTNFRCFKTILIDLNVNKYTFGFTNIWPNKMYYFYTSGTFSYNLTSNISIHICQSFTCLCLKNINTNLLIINYNILLKDILNKSPLKFKIFILS